MKSVYGLGLAGALLFSALGPAGLSGCKATGVGDPCTPEAEYDPQFNGFDEGQVNLESKSFQCQTRLCLVNHFRGRVSCPYGQKSDGTPHSDLSKPCTVPGGTEAIQGNPADEKKGKEVEPQCTDRSADKAVYCSCRCANIDGKTDDGGKYCECPDGFSCTQLVNSIGTSNEGLTGAYCIKAGTAYDRNGACASSCEPSAFPCP